MDNVKRIWLDQGQNPSQSRYSLVNDEEERPLQSGDSLESQTREEWPQVHSKNSSSGSSRIRHIIHLGLLYALIATLAGYAFTGRTASSDLLQQDLVTPQGSLAEGSKAANNGQLPAGKRFAYAQYVTNRIYLCNALIMFKRLRHFGAKAEFALTFPSNWHDFQVSDTNDDDRHIAFLLDQARDLGVHFHAYEPIKTEEANGFYLDVNNKFSVFNLTDYDRIIYMDSDALAYNHFDDLFTLPSTPLAIPRAYWYQESNYLTSAFMIIEPSAFLHQKVIDRLPGGPDHVSGHVLDMDVVNDLAAGWAMLLPHRGLFMLSNDLRDGEDDPGHQRYLRASQSGLKWDAEKEFSSVRLFHFSEKGPKQWEGHQRMDSFCKGRTDAGCKAWMQLLDDYLTSVDDVCTM